MRMSTHIAAYGSGDDVIYEPPQRILGIDLVGQCCFLKFFDHVDQVTGEADIYTVPEPPYVQAIVPARVLLRVLDLQTSAQHVRSARVPALGGADTFRCAEEILVVSVIGDTAHLDVHRTDPDLRRPIYPSRGSIRVPAADLIQALDAHIAEELTDRPTEQMPLDEWEGR